MVLPSRRAAVFLQRELARQLEKPRLAPRMMSIEELIFEASELEAVSRPELYFRLYEHLQKGGRPDLKFEDYNRWARALIQDFNEIDRYLIKPQEIFSYLGDLKRIESWNLEPGEHTRMLDDYLKFWPSLADVYHSLRDDLLGESKAWQGLAYRAFADATQTKIEDLKLRYGYFYFVGFNALNTAEEKALLDLYEAGIASFYWDVDSYYFSDTKQEAGLFLRQSQLVRRLQKHDAFYGLGDYLGQESRQLSSYAVAGLNLQAVVSAEVLSKMAPEQQENTALILSDESLLPAFLNNFHPNFPKLNLSMGLSLQNSPLAGYFEILLDFPLDADRHKRKNKEGFGRYHHKRWEAFLAHPISLKIAGENQASLRAALHHIKKRNLLYPSWQDLNIEGFEKLDSAYFKAEQSPAVQYKRLADFCESVQELLLDESSIQEALFGFHQLFRQTALLLERYPYLNRFEDSIQFYREMLPDLSIDLRGEPLQGMQVMGWLETRCLDFENLVVLSLNEGVLPKGRSDSSLIPFDVKRKYKLPTYLEKDAVFAYHFYRILQRAKNIHLMYSTAEAAIGVVEPSRFLRQVELEWPLKNQKLKIESHIVTGFAKQAGAPEQVPKTPAVIERLLEIAEDGFSPSSLIMYLRDPLQFYYEKVLRLKPDDEVMEELDLPSQGSYMHRYLEWGFSKEDPNEPEKRIPISLNAEDTFFSRSQQEIKEGLKTLMAEDKPGIPLEQGPNLLHLETMSLMLSTFLKAEQKRIENMEPNWELLALEKDLRGSIFLENGQEIKLKGNADRIERHEDIVHIIDYKTGGKNKADYNVTDCELESYFKKPEALQLPVYALMYAQAHPTEPVTSSIFSLRKVTMNPIKMKIEDSELMDTQSQAVFTEVLKSLFEEMLDPEIPFASRT